MLPCTPEILDVQVLPPLEPNTAHDRHIPAIELQNRSQSGCPLLTTGHRAFITSCQPQVSTKIFAARLFPHSIHPRCAAN